MGPQEARAGLPGLGGWLLAEVPSPLLLPAPWRFFSKTSQLVLMNSRQRGLPPAAECPEVPEGGQHGHRKPGQLSLPPSLLPSSGVFWNLQARMTPQGEVSAGAGAPAGLRG